MDTGRRHTARGTGRRGGDPPRAGQRDTSRRTPLPRPAIYEAATLGGLAIGAFILTGIGGASFGLFINPLRSDLGWSARDASWVPASFYIASAIVAPFGGWLIDRIGIRIVLPIGVTLEVAGIYLASQASSLPLFLVGVGLAGASARLSGLSFIYLLTTGLRTSVGFGVGVYICGASAGGSLLPVLINWMIAHSGWRAALGMNCALLAATVLPLALLLGLSVRPAFRAVAPRLPVLPTRTDGEGAGAAGSDGMRVVRYLLVAGMEMLFMVSVAGIGTHFVPILTGRGLPASQAVLVLAVCGLAGAASRLGTAWIAERMGYPATLLACIAGQAIAPLLLGLVEGPDQTSLVWGAALMLGICAGGVSQLALPLIKEIVPAPLLGRCLGIQGSYIAAASSLGVLLMGVFADAAGYSAAIIASSAAALCAAIPLAALCLLNGGTRGQARTTLRWRARPCPGAPQLE